MIFNHEGDDEDCGEVVLFISFYGDSKQEGTKGEWIVRRIFLHIRRAKGGKP
jgi:hypothetical protein